jgi:hypothetical protein
MSQEEKQKTERRRGKRNESGNEKQISHSKKGNKSAVMNDRASHKFSACIHFSVCSVRRSVM